MKPSAYTRPAKPLHLTVRSRRGFAKVAFSPASEIPAVDKSTECHVTPPDIAARMVRYLGDVGDYLTLEPSAGTGNLSRALIESGHSRYELVQVERHIALSAQLHQFGTVINRCFLEYAAEVRGRVEFTRVIMNPPFSEAEKHVAAARDLMGRHGHCEAPTLVALVPTTFQADGMETLEELPAGTFPTTRVRTKIIRIRLTTSPLEFPRRPRTLKFSPLANTPATIPDADDMDAGKIAA